MVQDDISSILRGSRITKMDTYRFIIIYTIFLCISELALAEVQIEHYELGISGQWRQNNWIPLRFVVKSTNEPFDGKIIAQVDRGSPFSMPLNLSYKDLKAGTLYLFLNSVSPQISLSLVNSEGKIVDRKSFIPKPPKRLEDLVILVIAPTKDALMHLRSGVPGTNIYPDDMMTKDLTHVSYVDTFRNLPKRWIGYSSIDLIIIKELPLDRSQISPNQQQALIDWVTAGGTLLIPGGANYQYIARGFIKSLLPVEFIEMDEKSHRYLRSTERSTLKSLESRFGFDFDPSSNFDLIKTRTKSSGQIVLGDEKIPLLVERKFGDGKTVFMAFDYSVSPFSDEPGFQRFWAWFMKTLAKSEIRKQMVYEPYRRHEKRIRSLLAENLSKKTPLMRFAGVFIILYVVFVAIGNFFLKRYTRNAKKIIGANFIVILTFTAILLLSQKVWENDILLKNVSIMTIYPESKRVRLNSYIALVGERSATQTLEFETFPFLRAMSNTADLEFVQCRPFPPENPDFPTQRKGSSYKLDNLHIAPWAMNAFHSQSFLDIAGTIQLEGVGSLSVSLAKHDRDDRSTREQDRKKCVVISNDLRFALEDVCVIYQNRLGKIEKIAEGNDVTIELNEELNGSIPPVFGRSQFRREFSKILENEGVLEYLSEIKSPILLGWIKKSFIEIRSKNCTVSGETLVVWQKPRRATPI